MLKRSNQNDEQGQIQEINQVPVFELCNKAVSKMLGFTPQVKQPQPNSILKTSSIKLFHTPLFQEYGQHPDEESLSI